MASRVGFFGLLVLALLAGACGPSAAANTDAVETPLGFADAQPTLDALARHVLNALARQDTSALERVRLTQREHNQEVWPELPASAPEVAFPIDYAWANIQNRNRRSLGRILPLFADRTLGYQDVECRGGTETFDTFVVHTDCYLIFSVEDGSERWEVQAFQDVVERKGGHKIFRYYDEEPRRYRGPGRP